MGVFLRPYPILSEPLTGYDLLLKLADRVLTVSRAMDNLYLTSILV